MPLHRLRSSRDVRAVFAARNVRHGSVASVHLRAREDDGPPRATVVAGRKVGGAVVRNRAKRRLRSALAEAALPSGTDVVVVARPASVTAPYATVRSDVERLAASWVRSRRGART